MLFFDNQINVAFYHLVFITRWLNTRIINMHYHTHTENLIFRNDFIFFKTVVVYSATKLSIYKILVVQEVTNPHT